MILQDFQYEVPSGTNDGVYMMLPTNIADLNHDYKVDMMDISIEAAAFGTTPDHLRWNPVADIAGGSFINIYGLPSGPDGKTDIRDVALVAHNFGWTPIDP